MASKRSIKWLALAALVCLCYALLNIRMQPARSLSLEDFNPRTFKGETGKVSVSGGHRNFELFLVNEKARKYMIVKSEKGTATVPVGNYHLVDVTITQDGKNGSWQASCRPPKAYTLKVKSGSTQQLLIGPPFVASINVKQSGSRATMDLHLKDFSGWDATVRPTSDKSKPPTFRVMSSSKTVLWQGSFKYG